MESFQALLAALSLVGLTVAVHYEGLRTISVFTANLTIPHRALSLVVIAGVLLAHLIEVCLFAVGFFLMHAQFGLGAIGGHFNRLIISTSPPLLTQRWAWVISSRPEPYDWWPVLKP